MSSFGSGLGTVIGASMGSDALNAGQGNVNSIAGNFTGQTEPYNQFGQSFLPTATNSINNINSVAGTTQGYEDFMKNYQMTPGAQYQEGVANATQNNSAASKGQLLSGS